MRRMEVIKEVISYRYTYTLQIHIYICCHKFFSKNTHLQVFYKQASVSRFKPGHLSTLWSLMHCASRLNPSPPQSFGSLGILQYLFPSSDKLLGSILQPHAAAAAEYIKDHFLPSRARELHRKKQVLRHIQGWKSGFFCFFFLRISSTYVKISTR